MTGPNMAILGSLCLLTALLASALGGGFMLSACFAVAGALLAGVGYLAGIEVAKRQIEPRVRGEAQIACGAKLCKEAEHLIEVSNGRLTALTQRDAEIEKLRARLRLVISERDRMRMHAFMRKSEQEASTKRHGTSADKDTDSLFD